MPKAAKNKKNAAGSGGPYAAAAAKSKAANAIFKFNTDLGQHILKNPGVAQAIVDKADLKQSDVCLSSDPLDFSANSFNLGRSRSRSRYR